MTAESTAVQRTITVNAGVEKCFRVFTEGADTWWPRTHHIGKSPMKKCLIEGWVGGRCYSRQEDGTDCPWGEVTAWDPPHRFVMAWKITHAWGYEPDNAKASEVEVRFTPVAGGATRVDLEHRGFERMPAGGDEMRNSVGGDGGWNGLLQLFAAKAGEPDNAEVG